jgi:AcrR family transcriptional regulator
MSGQGRLRHKRDKERTRQRLLEAAGRVFNRSGYDGTDSNRLARAAGYAPATFYKHFADKRECFLQVYEGWVDAEWTALSEVLAAGGNGMARELVDTVVRMHQKWRGLRGSLRGLLASDDKVRSFQRQQRCRQLELLADLRRRRRGMRARTRAEDAVLLLAMERTADALADGEIAAIDAGATAVRALLVKMVEQHLND